MKNLIYKELSKKLTAESGGNCKDDASCIYGFGTNQCSAGEKVIDEKYSAFKREVQARKPYRPFAVVPYSYDAAAWPCAEFMSITFTNPAREAKTPTAEI